jgi:aminoglycoside phosphotransferase family enzyme
LLNEEQSAIKSQSISKDDPHSKLLNELLTKVTTLHADIKRQNTEDMLATVDHINQDIQFNTNKLSGISKTKDDLQNRNNKIKEEIIKQQNESDLLTKL